MYKQLDEIVAELNRAKQCHSKPDHPDYTVLHPDLRLNSYVARAECDRAFAEGEGSWSHILTEEVAEALEEAQFNNERFLREELIQIAAVCLGWVEAIDARSFVSKRETPGI